jgi:hypothetical protein
MRAGRRPNRTARARDRRSEPTLLNRSRWARCALHANEGGSRRARQRMPRKKGQKKGVGKHATGERKVVGATAGFMAGFPDPNA